MATPRSLTDEELRALDEHATCGVLSIEAAARYRLAKSEHRRRMANAGDLIIDVHADALGRLG